MLYDFERDPSLTYLVSFIKGRKPHQVRFTSEEGAIDFAASMNVAAIVYKTSDFTEVFHNIHTSKYKK